MAPLSITADDFTFLVIKNTFQNKAPVEVCKVSHTSGFTMFAFESSLNWDQDGDPQSYGLNNPSTDSTNTQHGLVQHESHLSFAGDPAQNCQLHLDNPNTPSDQHLFRWAAIMSAQADPVGYKRDTRPFLESRVLQERDAHDNLIPLGSHEDGFFPVIQKSPNAGYYISTTSDQTGVSADPFDQNNYVDSTKISYSAHAGWWKPHDVLLGDFGLAFFPEKRAFTGFAFADTGVGKVGECSTKFFANIWPGQSPYNVNTNNLTFLVFPSSGRTTRRQDKYSHDAVIQQKAKALVQGLNAIDDISPLVVFLALGASATAYQLFSDRKIHNPPDPKVRGSKAEDREITDAQSAQLEARYYDVAAVLKSIGVTAGGL